MAVTVLKVTPPYSSEIHTLAWESWDEYASGLAEKLNLPVSEIPIIYRTIFMDGFTKGLPIIPHD